MEASGMHGAAHHGSVVIGSARPPAVASRALHRALAQVLGSYSRSHRRCSARDRDRLDHDPAAARAGVGELIARLPSRTHAAITPTFAKERGRCSGYDLAA